MSMVYYPGCTLHQKAKSFDKSLRGVASVLSLDLKEQDLWYCCGAVSSRHTDNLITLTSAVRNLSQAKKVGAKEFVVACSACFNVHRRVNKIIKEDKEKREKLNLFIEEDYQGEVKVSHFIEVIKDKVGFENLKEKIVRKPKEVKIGAYYGCLLLRPYEEVEFADPENPQILEDLLRGISILPVNFPYRNECCGAYVSLSFPEVVRQCVFKIVDSAKKNGAEALITSCPLCFFNLEWHQKKILSQMSNFQPLPVFYFTEFLALVLGLPEDLIDLAEHSIQVESILSRLF